MIVFWFTYLDVYMSDTILYPIIVCKKEKKKKNRASDIHLCKNNTIEFLKSGNIIGTELNSNR